MLPCRNHTVEERDPGMIRAIMDASRSGPSSVDSGLRRTCLQLRYDRLSSEGGWRIRPMNAVHV